MSRRESYLTFPAQKDANARFYTRVGTPKYLITKPIENQVNIVTTLVTRIKAWKSRNQWKVLFLCLFLYIFQWTKPCYHSSCYCTWYCKLLLYFSADHAQKTIYGLLQAFSSSRFQASDQRKLLLNIKWQVSGEEGKQDATELAYTSASWLWN